MIKDLKEKLKDAYDDAFDYFNGEDKYVELLEKAVWSKYHADVAEFAKFFAEGNEQGGTVSKDDIILPLIALQKKRDDKLAEISEIEEQVEKAAEAIEDAEEAKSKD